MSKLEKLEKELYGEEDAKELEHRTDEHRYTSEVSHEIPTRWADDAPSPAPKEAVVSKRTLVKIIGGILGVIAVLATVLVFFLYFGNRGKEAKVAIFARSPIESGELVTVPITVKNVSRYALREAEITIVFPDATLLVEDNGERPVPPLYSKKLDDFAPGEERTIEVKTRMFGHEGEEKRVDATLLYRPENLTARFSAKESQGFTIGRVPLAIAWEIPNLLSSGQEVLINVHYSSSAKASFSNMSLRLYYPPGFNFISANPAPGEEQNIWKIGTLDPGKEDTIHVRGTVAGEEGEVKAFRAELGVYNELTKEWRSYSDSVAQTNMAVSPLSVQGSFDGSRDKTIDLGLPLQFTIHYKNNTQYTVRNVSVRANLQEAPAAAKERVIDTQSLQIDRKGVFDSATRSIIWGPSNVPELQDVAPAAEGTFTFRIGTKEHPAIRNMEDKNISLVLKSSIEAASVPQELSGTRVSSEDSVTFKVNTQVLFSGRAAYHTSPLVNSGPLPPRMGNKTVYTIIWEVKNFTNDLQNADITAAIPPNVKWENNISPANARIFFDPASGTVHWHIGELRAGIGVLTPTIVGAFQVSLTPAETDIGQSPSLIEEAHFTGTDSFTGTSVQQKLPRFSTQLPDDPLTGQKDWKVVR